MERQKQRLDWENWSWLINKHWLPEKGLAATSVAKWGDILTGADGFDVYHFQMLIFSLVVGVALVQIGLTDLATFDVPPNVLAVLGLSQVVYVGGRIVDQPTMQELNDGLKKLRELEAAIKAAAGGATSDKIAEYQRQLDLVKPMFVTQFGDMRNEAILTPS